MAELLRQAAAVALLREGEGKAHGILALKPGCPFGGKMNKEIYRGGAGDQVGRQQLASGILGVC